MFEKIKRRIHGIEFYRIYYKPLGEQTGWSKYGDEYDGMPAPIPQDRFFDIEDPPKNRIYLCVGIKNDGKWAIGSDIPGTWKKKYGDDESTGGESKAELKKRLEKLEKGAENKSTPSTEEIAGIILWNHIEKKVEGGEDIWGVIGSLLNPQPNSGPNPYDMFDTNIKVEGNMPWWAHPGIVNMYTNNLPQLAENLSSSFVKGARKEMEKLEQQRQPSQQQPPPQEAGYAEEGAEPADAIAEQEGALDIEVMAKSDTVARILAKRAAEKREQEGEVAGNVEGAVETAEVVKSPEEVPSELKTIMKGLEGGTGIPEEVGTVETVPKSNIKEQVEPETGKIPEVGTEGKEGEEIEGETAEEVAKKEAMQERMRKAREVRAANTKAKKEAEGAEMEVEAQV